MALSGICGDVCESFPSDTWNEEKPTQKKVMEEHLTMMQLFAQWMIIRASLQSSLQLGLLVSGPFKRQETLKDI